LATTAQNVAFDFGLADYKALTAHIAATTRTKRWAVVAIGVGVFFSIIAVASFVEAPSTFLRGLLAILLVVLLAAKVFASVRRSELQPRPGGSVLCHHSVTLMEEGVDIHTPLWQLFARWSSIVAVEESPAHIFLRADPMRAYVIPKRAFANDEARRAFVDTALRYSQGAAA
jgi:hypothetical protein